MKKIAFYIISIYLSINVNAQNITWGTPIKFEESFSTFFTTISGHYIGNIDGNDIYTCYKRTKEFFPTTTLDLILFKTNKNELISLSELEKKKYNYISIEVLDDKIALFYFEENNEDKYEVKVDFYNPSDLKFDRSVTLFEYKPVDESHRIIKFTKNENNTLFGILTTAINPENKSNSFLVKTFDFQLEEKGETYFEVPLNETSFFKNFILQNDGYSIVSISEYKMKDYEPFIDKMHFIRCREGEAEFIELQEEEIIDLCDFQIFNNIFNQEKLIITERENIRIYDLSFKNSTYSETNSYTLKDGNWIIDKTIKLNNGTYFIALAKMGRERFESKNGPYMLEYFQSFNFLCFNPSINDFIYETSVGRYYSSHESIVIPNEKISRKPIYLQSGNKVTVVYNSTMTYPNEFAEKNGDDLKKIDSDPPKDLNYQKTVIDENGNVENSTLTNSVIEKTGMYSSFCHTNKDETITIVKVWKKDLTIGTIAQ